MGVFLASERRIFLQNAALSSNKPGDVDLGCLLLSTVDIHLRIGLQFEFIVIPVHWKSSTTKDARDRRELQFLSLIYYVEMIRVHYGLPVIAARDFNTEFLMGEEPKDYSLSDVLIKAEQW